MDDKFLKAKRIINTSFIKSQGFSSGWKSISGSVNVDKIYQLF